MTLKSWFGVILIILGFCENKWRSVLDKQIIITWTFSKPICYYSFSNNIENLKCLFALVNRTCKTGFILIDGHCYKIYDQARLNRKKARLNCSRDHGDLAKVSRTAQREGLSALLETLNLNIATEGLYLDLSRYSLAWLDGSEIDSSLWESGYPRKDDKSETCVVLDGYKGKIKNVPCLIESITGFICQSREGKN